MSAQIEDYALKGDSFSLSTHTVTGFHTMPAKHFHDKFEIYYLISGERFYFVKDKIFRIRKGHLIFINENELHRISDTEIPDYKRILLYFRKPFLAGHPYIERLMNYLARNPCWVLSLTVREQLFIEKIFGEMTEEITGEQIGYEASLQGLLLRLLAFIARHLESYDGEAYISNRPRHKKVAGIIRYLQENYMRPLSVTQLAEHFYISPCYLSRIFKETTGLTLVQYLNGLRMKEAHRLLVQTGLKVIEIAGNTGFGSVTQFNRVFRKEMGCSPLRYRKLQQ